MMLARTMLGKQSLTRAWETMRRVQMLVILCICMVARGRVSCSIMSRKSRVIRLLAWGEKVLDVSKGFSMLVTGRDYTLIDHILS